MRICWQNFQGYDGQKYAPGWKTLDVDWPRLAKGITKCCWSGNIWADGYRKYSNFIQSDFCVLDFDSGETSLAAAVDNYFCDMQHIIATTRSHQKNKGGVTCDRFRVILLWDKTIRCPQVYEWNLKELIDTYYADPSAFNASRFFYPSVDIVSTNFDPDAYKMNYRRSIPEKKFAPEKVEPRENVPLIDEILSGKGDRDNRNADYFRMACEAYKANWPPDKLERLILSKPDLFKNFVDTKPNEIRDTIRSAYKYKRERLGGS